MADRWHLRKDAGGLTLSRRWPPRFDVAVTSDFPVVQNPKRLAHQLRQDLWRAAQRVKGFTPTVEIREEPPVLRVTLGGQVQNPCNRHQLRETIAGLLDNTRARDRWIRCAGGAVKSKNLTKETRP